MLGELTEKQRRFAAAYVGPAKGNATEAARQAGYRGNANTLGAVGVENLRKPTVRAEVDRLLEAVRSAEIADAHEVQAFLTGVMRGTECRAPIVTVAGPVLDPVTGQPMTEPPEARDRVKAAVELATIRGYNAPKKHEHEVRGASVSFVFEDNGLGPAPK